MHGQNHIKRVLG